MAHKKTIAAAGILAIATPLALSTPAWGHGYTMAPPSRSYLCAQGTVQNCGPIKYEPQSLEGYGGFPQTGPPDGQICSAGIQRFHQLDDPRGGNWPTTTLHAGRQYTITWHILARHATSTFRYFITKNGWDPATKLTRAALQSRPFAVIPYHGQQPPATLRNTVTLPSGLTGHHILLSVWDIADTADAFYQCADVDFGNGGGSGDTQAPSAPAGLSATGTTDSSVSLSWQASTDNVGVTGYRVFRGPNQVGTVATTSYTDTGLSPDTRYGYTVRAVDAAGNVSGPSNAVTVTTSGSGGGGTTCVAAWQSNRAYTGGDEVSYQGDNWTAKWWSWGEQPGNSSGAWQDDGACAA